MRGSFSQPALLWESCKTDARILSSVENRLAPHRGLSREISAKYGSGSVIAKEATLHFCDDEILSPGAICDGFEDLAWAAFGVLHVDWIVNEDGSRLMPSLTAWPLECVRYDSFKNQLMALTETGDVPIVHGDGRWIVVQKRQRKAWQSAAGKSAFMLFATRQLGIRDRSNSAESHGDDKWLGTLPEGIALDSPEALKLLQELLKMYEPRRALVVPFGATVKRDEALAQNYQIFKELIESCDRDVQCVFLGQDGSMTNSGGNYVKAWGLFGVRNDIIESDLSAMGRAISTGLLRPWSLVNFGRWDRLQFKWLIPDADEDARRESIAKRHDDFDRIVKARRENGFVVDQAFCDALAAELGIATPALADATPSGSDFFAYELDGGIVTIDEVRARKGLPPLPNGAGALTVPEARARAAAAASQGPAPAPGA
jgi:hypothetical protein